MKDKPKKDGVEKLSYEEALKKLEKIVGRLEDPELALEESLNLFQEGISLSRFLKEKLTEIEFKIEYLLKEEEQAKKEEQSSAKTVENQPLIFPEEKSDD